MPTADELEQGAALFVTALGDALDDDFNHGEWGPRLRTRLLSEIHSSIDEPQPDDDERPLHHAAVRAYARFLAAALVDYLGGVEPETPRGR